MALLNRNNFYYFGRGEPQHRTETSLSMVRPLKSFEDTDYWLIDFFSYDGIAQIKDYVPEDILQRARDGTLVLLMHNSHEAFHDIVDPIYHHIVEQLNIPPKQILLLSESAIIRNVIKEVALAHNKEEIQAEWIRIFEFNVRVPGISYQVQTLRNKTYHKKFLNLNRRWRHHRTVLVGLLEIYGLRDQGFVSLADHSDGGGNWLNVLYMIPYYVKDEKLNKLFQDNAELVSRIPPLYLDTTELHINQATLTNSTDQYYEDSYFSVVTETTFFKQFGEGVFLSEKIFKPIIKRHPFIILSRPNTLTTLRSIGYKTFDGIIDESYDLEEDDDKRMLMIIEEINRLCNLNENELQHFLQTARDICEHNYKTLLSKKEWITVV